jgi:hypothetical protein
LINWGIYLEFVTVFLKPNVFITRATAVAFQPGFWPIRRSKNLGKPLMNFKKLPEKYYFSEGVFPSPREENFL